MGLEVLRPWRQLTNRLPFLFGSLLPGRLCRRRPCLMTICTQKMVPLPRRNARAARAFGSFLNLMSHRMILRPPREQSLVPPLECTRHCCGTHSCASSGVSLVPVTCPCPFLLVVSGLRPCKASGYAMAFSLELKDIARLLCANMRGSLVHEDADRFSPGVAGAPPGLFLSILVIGVCMDSCVSTTALQTMSLDPVPNPGELSKPLIQLTSGLPSSVLPDTIGSHLLTSLSRGLGAPNKVNSPLHLLSPCPTSFELHLKGWRSLDEP